MMSAHPSWLMPLPHHEPIGIAKWRRTPAIRTSDGAPTHVLDLPLGQDTTQESHSWDGVEDYVMGLVEALPEIPRQYALYSPSSDRTTESHLWGLAAATQRGRLWFMDHHPIQLDMDQITNTARQTSQKRRFSNNVDPAIADLVRSGPAPDPRHWKTPLDRYIVRPEEVEPAESSPGLSMLLSFLEGVRGFSKTFIGLSVTGWHWNRLEHPPLVLQMLVKQFNHVVLEVDSQSSLVGFIIAHNH